MRSSTTTLHFPSPAAGHSSITHTTLGPLCGLLVLTLHVRGSIRHSVGYLSSSVKVRVVGQRSCTCSACVRLHVLRFTRPYTRRPPDLQLDLWFRVALSSNGFGFMELCRASSTPRSCGRMPTPKCVRPDRCCSSLEQCVFKISFRQI
jgi:hypothetical protein